MGLGLEELWVVSPLQTEQLLSQRTALGGTFAHWDSWSSPGGLQVWGEGPAGAFAELGRTGTN